MQTIKYLFLGTFLILFSLSVQARNKVSIVKFKNIKQADKMLSEYNATVPLFVTLLQEYISKTDNTLSAKQNELIKSLLSYRIIETDKNNLFNIDKSNIYNIEPNYFYHIEQDNTKPNDPRYYEQWALRYLNIEKAWQKASGKGILVGVVDTGIEWEHEDLQNQIWLNPAEDINGNGKFDPWPSNEQVDGVNGDLNGIDDDNNGIIDDLIGYDFVNQSQANLGDNKTFDPIPTDEYGHGTLVSGVIAAERNNHKGIAGVAYNSKIVTLRAFDMTGQGLADNIASAIVYGVLNGVKVFNLSFGEKQNSSMMQDAINFAIESGCVVVASSGNEGSDDPHYPSDYEGVISVGYAKQDGTRNGFSNYGSRLDLLAPGTSILTTSFVGDYRTASGTSLAAPFVSATAALLLELTPNLSPFDIQGIIDNSANDISLNGWDVFYGAGVLDINRALEFNGITNLIIKQPLNEQTFYKSEINSILFYGSLIVPLIKDYKLLLGEGYNPTDWTELAERKNQIKNDTIYVLKTNKLKDTSYTFRILVNLRNNNTIEKRVRFNVFSNKSDVRIIETKNLPAFSFGKRIMLSAIETNIPTVAYITIEDKYTGAQHRFTDLMKRTKYHLIPVDDFIQPGIEYDCIITVSADVLSDKTITKNITIKINDDKFSIDKFVKKKYSTTLSYIYNKTGDFNSNGKSEYVANDLSYGVWNGTDVYEYKNGEMIKSDSTKQIRLPVGIGDSNGDGIDEVLTRNVGSSVLYQAPAPQYSLFSKILFSDTTSGNFFAGTMYDFTGDNKEELICYSDTAVYILTFENNAYKIIATAMLDGEYKRIGTAPGIVCGDFDGDGKQELAFGNDRGNIFIFEFNNNALNFEYSNIIDYSYSPQYMTTADVNNDGKPEIVIANYGTQMLFGKHVSAEPVWSLKILKSIGHNNYGYFFGEYFYGVKQGSTPAGVFFRNGLSAGNIGPSGDAVLFSPFPNMYIFSWDDSEKKILPFWYYPSAFANSAIIHDFDENGINEFGFSTGRKTEFFEYDRNASIPNTPVELDGWSVDDNSVFLQWKSTAKDNSPEPAKFFLFYGIEKDNYIDILGTAETNEYNYTFDGLNAGTDYWFGIAAIAKSGLSSDTLIKLIHHHKPIELKQIKQINRRRFALSFSGKVPELMPVPSTFTANGSVAVSITRAGDSTLTAFWDIPLPLTDVEFHTNSFRDYYNAPSKESSMSIEISEDIPAPDELYLSDIRIISFYELDLRYSEPVKTDEASDKNNYDIQPSGKIESVSPTQDASVVRIFLDKTSPVGPLGKEYTITVNNVHSQTGKQMTEGAGNTIAFTFQANDLANVFVYPNPVRISTGVPVYFANLTDKAEVYIYDLEGRELAVLKEIGGNGGVEWDVRDKQGNLLPTGIYLFNVKGKDKNGNSVESGLKKFAVVR
jgi:subtilisin family serine protease